MKMYSILSQSKPLIIIYHKKSKFSQNSPQNVFHPSKKEFISSLTNFSHQKELSGCHNQTFQ